ncbi:uncharacterized protein LOC122541378 isoform X3 [Chiloscyllium plagiosum]|uniref:uncharacterized protein LOC122541378 isoform X3 n=1 Tax=Chiloscyllium plagiosum TaxID=36176 RepID=UPI001CB87FA2|nr:uncharacterized protein LOC122541378 isoform X3 [Chiloscyllium plagiosum]
MSASRNGIPKMCGACLFAFNPFALLAAVTLRVSQDSVNGTVGESVLLAVSYTVSDPGGYLRIRWTRAGIRMVDYRCISDRDNSLSGRCHYLPVPGDYKHRVVLFPENASLLLQHLHFNDSGIYELSVSHSEGTETAKITLMVQNTTECGMGCNRIQKRTVKKKTAQGGWNSLSSNSAVTFSEMKLYKSTGAMERKMYATDENIEHARIQILRT